jgi:pimeloyl-ACP methyl ester carboxylesterase
VIPSEDPDWADLGEAFSAWRPRGRDAILQPSKLQVENALCSLGRPLDSGWNDVAGRLQAAGIAVQAISNPLRGITADAAYVASAIRQIPGPALAVGHSYGGAVITNAAPTPATSSAWSTSLSPQMKARPCRTSKATPRTAS